MESVHIPYSVIFHCLLSSCQAVGHVEADFFKVGKAAKNVFFLPLMDQRVRGTAALYPPYITPPPAVGETEGPANIPLKVCYCGCIFFTGLCLTSGGPAAPPSPPIGSGTRKMPR